MASVNLSDGDTIKVNVSSEETLNTNLQDINYIPGYIAAEEERRTNEASRISNESTRIANEDTRIENEIAREEYIADLKQRVENGEFNGDIVDVKVDGTSVTENGIAYVDLSGKVDKKEGKGLSTNDYTTEEKTKLGDLANVKSIGSGLSLDSDGKLSNTQTSANWGNITGTLSEQTDLQEALNGKANSTHTHTTTDITDFPTVPSDLSDLTDETNILAGKQNTLIAGDNITIENNVISSTGGSSDKVGVIKLFSGSTAPDGWLICDGSAISRTTYSDLFALIGTTYGEGDGSTTFNIPNIKGRTVVGLDSSDDDFNILGKTIGEKEHSLTINEIPSHTHGTAVTETSMGAPSGNASMAVAYLKTDGFPTGSTGGGQEHNNIQPSIVLNYIIKVSTTTSIQGEIVDSLDGNSTTKAPSVRAVNEGLGNVRGQILWTNPNSQTQFSAQNITLSSDDYDVLEWYFRLGYDNNYVKSYKIPKGYGGKVTNHNDDNSLRYRYINRNSDTSFSITSTEFKGALIPMYVIGYKTGLFNN